MTYMFPSAGTIRNVTVCIDSLGEDDTALLEVGPHGAGSLERVEIQGGLQMLSFEFRVVRGDRIVVKALSDVSDVWVAFEYQVDKPKDAGD